MRDILRGWFQSPGKAKIFDNDSVIHVFPKQFSAARVRQLLTNAIEGEPLQGQALQDFVIDKVDDLKAQDIVALNVQGKSSITDYMVICTGTSTRHVASIADHVVQSSRAAGLIPLGVEGENASDWVVVDLGDVMVHVMQEESRQLYELEKLWG